MFTDDHLNTKNLFVRKKLFCLLPTDDKESAQQLIQSGADVNAVNLDGKHMNQFKVKKNERTPAFAGFTPLLRSVRFGNAEIIRIFIENGANVNAINDDGESALNLAAKNSKNYVQNMELWMRDL